eukprot:scaffold75016_cov46-Cyclotella_meneghiniana.AAC.2
MNLSASFALMIANGLMVKSVTPTTTPSPTKAPITSAPSTAALSYTLVGDGECVDGSNEHFSFIVVEFDSSPSLTECNALCSDVDYFYHPSLVGFAQEALPPRCFCYYTGGTVPSIPPPKKSGYSQYLNRGNGPVISSDSLNSNLKCYAYAQGTGSPTTPGATKHPITPSPTGSITSAPTPVGIASWNKIGSGGCTDSYHEIYSSIQGGQIATPAECAQFCHKLPSPYLVGFVFDYENDDCFCLYSGQNVPTPPSGIGLLSIDTSSTGTGPIRGTDDGIRSNCYAFAQGTAAPTTSTPSTAALSYTLVGNGLCLDRSNQLFSRIETPVFNPSPNKCNHVCSVDFYHPSLVGFAFGMDQHFDQLCICFYTGGTVPSIPPLVFYEYNQVAGDGNGSLMSSDSLPNYVCYAYAQGTGSPTTPGATNHPITPSPTGSITSAPTPAGIASWNKIGTGLCTDSNHDQYSLIASNNVPTPAECAQFCHKLPSPYLVGFEYSAKEAQGFCNCLYSGQNVPTPPSGFTVEIYTSDIGTGPIRGTDTGLPGFDCYAFVQGTATPTTTASPTTTSMPTKPPVTSAPTTAALSYSLVGNGLCLDKSNLLFPGIRFAVYELSPASCNAVCSVDFYHPSLVGFAFGFDDQGDQGCICFYTGGTVPSIPPPKNMRYAQNLGDGNGPVVSSDGSPNTVCYAYAQGTGSPTTPGATNHPITPSPTGSITSAPTPAGIAWVYKIGSGYCQDANDKLYNYIAAPKIPTPAECAQFCYKLPSPYLVGFEYSALQAQGFCSCLYSGQNLPTPPYGLSWEEIENIRYRGTGPIKGTRLGGVPGIGDCYAFSQGTAAPVTSTPSTAALSYTLVGNGLCLDGSNQLFSRIETPVYNPSPAECNALCSDVDYFYHSSLVGFAPGVSASDGSPLCSCFYTGGTVPSIPPPKNLGYHQSLNGGNGPVISSDSDINWKCYAYAQGTGSPTTPGATNHPITSSPTGSTTSAPTPVGIASWSIIGSGYCADANNDRYNYIAASRIPTPAECAQFCHKLPSPYLVGFDYSALQAQGFCSCLYSGQNLPTPPSGLSWEEIENANIRGTGPIRGTIGGVPGIGDCYAFSQGPGRYPPCILGRIASIMPRSTHMCKFLIRVHVTKVVWVNSISQHEHGD